MFKQLGVVAIFLLINGCGSGTGVSQAPAGQAGTSSGGFVSEAIRINQLGYLNTGEKIAIVPNTAATEFTLVSASDNSVVYSGQLSASMSWLPAGSENVKRAEFSDFNVAGEYFIRVNGLDSDNFRIDETVYEALHDALLKAYYYNRSSTSLAADHAGQWARAAGHPDTSVMVHASAASSARPTGTLISSPKGWYDAGDFGKYTVNSGISVFTLLAAYEHFSDFYNNRDLNIPESGNAMPDILDEVKWNLDWLATMQDEDGGVYHKLTTLRFAGAVMPEAGTAQRYVIGKGTAASLDFAAMMAMASRIYSPYDAALAAQWLAQAEAAWEWALTNPNTAYRQPADVSTGAYGNRSFADEFAWAAAELFISTGNSAYLDAFKAQSLEPNVPGWPSVHALPFISLLSQGESLLDSTQLNTLRSQMLALADEIVEERLDSAYRVPMLANNFVWGSNSVAANKGMVLMQAYRETNDEKYRDATLAIVSYLLGLNPTHYSFVTGFGHLRPMHIHHRQSEADDIVEPVPGFLVGGPQNGQQDGCDYPSSSAAKSYLDDWCSYSTNEVTINWNAPFLYLLAALQAD